MKKILVLGLGNILMNDDGAGIVVVRELKKSLAENENLKIMDGGTLGLDLLGYIEWADKLIIVDAVDMGFEPGTVIRAEGEDINPIFESKLSPHQMGLRDILLASELTGKIHNEVILFGIQIESIQMEMTLSKRVSEHIEKLKDNVSKEIIAN